LLDWAPNRSGLSPTPVLPYALIGGANQLMVVRHVTLRAHKRRKGARDMLDEVRCDLIPLIYLSDRSLRRNSGGKHHTAPSPPPPPRSCRLTPDPKLPPLHRADLLPHPRQVPLRQLRRCQALQTSPTVICANPKNLYSSHLDRLELLPN
jgi:hypothetical protein